MTSPDLAALADLTLYDRTAFDLVDVALRNAEAKVPEWQPRDGNIEMVLLEAMGFQVAELAHSVNRVPAAALSGLVRLHGVQPHDGTAPTGTLSVLFSTDQQSLPAGVTFRLPLADGTGLDLVTTQTVTADVGQTIVTAPFMGAAQTAAANGALPGTRLLAVTSMPSVEVARLSTITAGADPESETDWLSRGTARFARQSDALLVARHFVARALEDPLVRRAFAVEAHDGTAPAGGHVAVAVAGTGGAPLAAADMEALRAAMQELVPVDVTVHVVAPAVTDVNVSAIVKARPGADVAAVQSSVTAALAAYLNPDTWPWSGTVRRNELIAVMDGALGVDYVLDGHPSVPAADLPLTGVAPLARLGTAKIQVLPA